MVHLVPHASSLFPPSPAPGQEEEEEKERKKERKKEGFLFKAHLH